MLGQTSLKLILPSIADAGSLKFKLTLDPAPGFNMAVPSNRLAEAADCGSGSTLAATHAVQRLAATSDRAIERIPAQELQRITAEANVVVSYTMPESTVHIAQL